MSEALISKIGLTPPKTLETTTDKPVQEVSPIISEKDSLKGAEHTKTPLLGGTSASGEPTAPQPATGGQGAKLGGMLSADLCVNLMDSLLPGLMVAGAYYAHVKIAKKDLQLTEKEKSTLSPIVSACLDSVNINMENPWLLLSLTVGIMYGSKFLEKGTMAKVDAKDAKEKEQALVNSNVIDMKKHAEGVKQEHPKTDDIKSTPITKASKVDPNTVIFPEHEIKEVMRRQKSKREVAIAALRKRLIKSLQ